jgi:hypothetical protein
VLLYVELLDIVELTVVFELLEPLVDDLLVFVEKHFAAECLTIVKQIKTKHIIFVLNFLEIKSFQKYNIYTKKYSYLSHIELLRLASLSDFEEYWYKAPL